MSPSGAGGRDRSVSARIPVIVAIVMAAVVAGPAPAADRSSIPLKNWGGFAVHRDAAYDDLERLVTAGLGGRTLLNTKPLSRIEAARIVARAIETIRRDAQGAYNARRDLEPVLDRLTVEFREELISLGVKLPGEGDRETKFVTFVPVDRAQVTAGFASRDLSFLNERGLRFQRGANGGTTFESRLQVGDFLTVYLEPWVHGNEEYGAARLASGYAKLTLFNVELLVGRESLWWGPGLSGSLILSNNAPPLDQIRIGAAEPFLLPWVGEWVGPTKLLFFLAQLEERRDHKRAKLAGMRGTIAPFSFLELGISRTLLFGGDDRPRLSLGDYPRAVFYPPAGDERVAEAKFRNDNLFAIDSDLRFRNVDRYFLPARDLRLYGEFGWDDTCCNSNFIPLKEAISGLVGVHLIGLFGWDEMDARLEYAETSGLSFVHGQFRSGYWTRGEAISHFVGTEGRSIYSRLTHRLTPNLMLGAEVTGATVGSTVADFTGPHERRVGGGLDLSYRFWDRYSLFAQYQLIHVDNRNFRPGDNGFDHLLRLDLTRSFR